MKKFVVAAICTVCMVGFALAEEYTLTIKSMEGGYLVGTKKMKGAAKGDPPVDVKAKIGKDVKVFKGKFDADTKGFVADGDADKDGLKSALLLSVDGKLPDKGQPARVTTNDKDEVTQILVITGGGGAKKGKKKGG